MGYYDSGINLDILWSIPQLPYFNDRWGVAERQPATNTALFQVTVVNQYIIVYPDILDKISRI